MLFTGRIQSYVNQEQIKQISLRAKRSIIITRYAVDVPFIDVSRDVFRILHKARKKHKHKQPKNKTTSKKIQNETNTNKTSTSIFPRREVTFIYSILCLKDRKSKIVLHCCSTYRSNSVLFPIQIELWKNTYRDMHCVYHKTAVTWMQFYCKTMWLPSHRWEWNEIKGWVFSLLLNYERRVTLINIAHILPKIFDNLLRKWK